MTLEPKLQDRMEAIVVWVGVPLMVFLAATLLFISLDIARDVSAQQEAAEERRAAQEDEIDLVLSEMSEVSADIGFLVRFVEDRIERDTSNEMMTCLLGSIAGQDGIRRPTPQETDRACAIFLHQADVETEE